MKSTSASTLELKLLPLNDSVKVICAVSTYFAPAGDSRIAFYDTNWKELPCRNFIQLPQEGDFYVVPQSDIQADSLKICGPMQICFYGRPTCQPNSLSFRLRILLLIIWITKRLVN